MKKNDPRAWLTIVRRVFSSVVSERATEGELDRLLKDYVFDDLWLKQGGRQVYTKLEIGRVLGYVELLRDNLMDKLEMCVCVDGKFYSAHRATKNKSTTSPEFFIKGDLSEHTRGLYWLGSQPPAPYRVYLPEAGRKKPVLSPQG